MNQSRRSLLRLLGGATAALATTSIAQTATPHPDARLFELEAQIVKAERVFSAALTAKEEPEKIVNQWKRDNPQPKMREIPVNDDDDRETTLLKILRYDTSADFAEYKRATRLWRQRKARKERLSGLRAAES